MFGKKVAVARFSAEVAATLLESVRKVCKEREIYLRQAVEFGLRAFLKEIEKEEKKVTSSMR